MGRWKEECPLRFQSWHENISHGDERRRAFALLRLAKVTVSLGFIYQYPLAHLNTSTWMDFNHNVSNKIGQKSERFNLINESFQQVWMYWWEILHLLQSNSSQGFREWLEQKGDLNAFSHKHEQNVWI